MASALFTHRSLRQNAGQIAIYAEPLPTKTDSMLTLKKGVMTEPFLRTSAGAPEFGNTQTGEVS
jgi:hypothetical protein